MDELIGLLTRAAWVWAWVWVRGGALDHYADGSRYNGRTISNLLLKFASNGPSAVGTGRAGQAMA